MNIFYDGWQSIARAIVAGVAAYLALIVMVRTAGNRTLAQLNAFDLVVTVALGSILATIVLSKDVTLATGVIAMTVLIGMQYGIAALSVRFERVRRPSRSEPRLLVRNGTLLRDAMRAERVTEDEILQALRSQGHARVEGVDAVILKTNATFSIVSTAPPSASVMCPFHKQGGHK